MRALHVLAEGPSFEDHEHVGVWSVLVLVAGRATCSEQLMWFGGCRRDPPLSFGCSGSGARAAVILPRRPDRVALHRSSS